MKRKHEKEGPENRIKKWIHMKGEWETCVCGKADSHVTAAPMRQRQDSEFKASLG